MSGREDVHRDHNMFVKYFLITAKKIETTGCPKKSVPQNPRIEVFFCKKLCKSNRPRVPRPVEMINIIKIYSRD